MPELKVLQEGKDTKLFFQTNFLWRLGKSQPETIIGILQGEAQDYVSEEMIDWGTDDIMSWNFVQLFPNKIYSSTEFRLLNSDGGEINLCAAESRQVPICGLIVHAATLAPFKSYAEGTKTKTKTITFDRNLDRLKKRYDGCIFESDEHNAFIAVADCLFGNLSVENALDAIKRKTGKRILNYCSRNGEYQAAIINPTQERLARAAEAYGTVSDFIREHRFEILGAAQLVYCGIKLEGEAEDITAKFNNQTSAAVVEIQKSAKDFYARADELLAKLEPPKTCLEDFANC